MTTLTTADLEVILADIRRDPGPFMERFFRIRTEEPAVRPFRFKAPQREMHDRVLAMQREQGMVRAIVLKARKEGISTYTQLLFSSGILSVPDLRARVLAHDRDTSQILASMSAFAVSQLPEELRPVGPRPSLNKLFLEGYQTSDGFYRLESSLIVDTATGKEVARGTDVHRLHLSEAAFYPSATRVMRSALNAVPKVPGTVVIIESTANGMAGDFYERWQAAEAGDSGYLPIFLPWFADSKYRAQPARHFSRTSEEEDLARKFQLDDWQLYWRRITIAAEFNGDLEGFWQEFPATPEEAFRFSGRPAFPTEVVTEYKAAARAVPYTDGDLDGARFVPRSLGELRLWEPPQPAGEYLLAADTAGGGETGDYSSVAIINRRSHRFVAEVNVRIDPRLFAHLIFRVGRYFHWALVYIEVNGQGLSTQLELVEHLRYPHIGRWRRYDNANRIWTDKLGWETNRRSRPMLIDDMSWGLRSKSVGLSSVRTLEQLLRFDADERVQSAGMTGEFTADETKHDDLAMAHLIAWHAHLNMPLRDGRHARELLAPAATLALDGLPPMPQDALSASVWASVDRERERRGTGAISPQVRELTPPMTEDGEFGEDPFPDLPDC